MAWGGTIVLRVIVRPFDERAAKARADHVVWMRAATVVLDLEGRYLDADARALDLLGVESVEALRAMAPDTFAAVPPDPEEQRAWREAYFSSRAEGVLAEVPIQRLDGELVRVRTAILEEPGGRFRALFYPIERPTTNLTTRIFRIADVLAEWRAAERRLVELPPGSDDAATVAAEIEVLREQHRQLFSRRSRSGGD